MAEDSSLAKSEVEEPVRVSTWVLLQAERGRELPSAPKPLCAGMGLAGEQDEPLLAPPRAHLKVTRLNAV